MRKICCFVVDRANYGRLRSVLQKLSEAEDIELVVIAAGSMVLDRFKRPINSILSDGVAVQYEVFMAVEGSNHLSMSKSIGLGIIEFASILDKEKPDLTLLIGDRFEALAAAIASAYSNVPIAHIQGGEVSGSIDESARHAISKFSSIHFPATARSKEYLERMGEDPAFVFNVGCPVGDYILSLVDHNLAKDPKIQVSGYPVDLERPYLLVIFHPNTTQDHDIRK